MVYHIVNAFSKEGKGGNPAAVVLNQSLSADEKQAVTRAIGFSETAFLNQQNDQLFIEFFTPEKPIAYCGHATIASVNILKQQQLIGEGNYLLQTRNNPIPVTIGTDKVFMEQRYPDFFEVNEMEETASLLTVSKESIRDVTIARNGVGFLLIELRDAAALYHLQPNQQLIYDYSARHDLIGLYAFTKQGTVIQSRMFAPYYGIKEENATGMAAGLLGGWQHYKSPGGIKEILIEQGYSPLMNEKGYLQVIIEDNPYKKILVGGEAIIKSTTHIEM